MSQKRLITLGTTLLLCASLVTPASAASNLRFMENSPLAYLSKKDSATLAEAAERVLTEKPDNASMSWSNAGTGNAVKITGHLTPTRTQKVGEGTCRNLIVRLTAKGQNITLELLTCKVRDDAPWELHKR